MDLIIDIYLGSSEDYPLHGPMIASKQSDITNPCFPSSPILSNAEVSNDILPFHASLSILGRSKSSLVIFHQTYQSPLRNFPNLRSEYLSPIPCRHLLCRFDHLP